MPQAKEIVSMCQLSDNAWRVSVVRAAATAALSLGLRTWTVDASDEFAAE
jgi:hypothetical protein